MTIRKTWWRLLVVLLVAGGGFGAPGLYPTALLGSGVMAQLLCSGTFVSKRDPATIRREDLSGPGYELLSLFQWHVDYRRKRVAASLLSLGQRSAIFHHGLGCTLSTSNTEDQLSVQFDSASGSRPRL